MHWGWGRFCLLCLSTGVLIKAVEREMEMVSEVSTVVQVLDDSESSSKSL